MSAADSTASHRFRAGIVLLCLQVLACAQAEPRRQPPPAPGSPLRSEVQDGVWLGDYHVKYDGTTLADVAEHFGTGSVREAMRYGEHAHVLCFTTSGKLPGTVEVESSDLGGRDHTVLAATVSQGMMRDARGCSSIPVPLAAIRTDGGLRIGMEAPAAMHALRTMAVRRRGDTIEASLVRKDHDARGEWDLVSRARLRLTNGIVREVRTSFTQTN